MNTTSVLHTGTDVSKRYLKARREYKKAPLFAYNIMLQSYPSYSYEEFLQDIKMKRKRKINTAQEWAQYGRYGQITKLVAKYCLTGKKVYINSAKELKKEMTHPYKIIAKTPSGYMQFIFSAMTPMSAIEKLVRKINVCKTSAKVLKVVADFEQLGGKH